MPAVDNLAVEYQGEVDVIAVAWRGSLADTAEVAARLLPSGATRWALDESVFATFEVASQPVSVLMNQGVEEGRWFGSLPVDEVRSKLDDAIRA